MTPKLFFLVFVLLTTLVLSGECSKYLSVSGERFLMNGKSVYLSGVNQPWVNYGDDFGNGAGSATFCQLNYTVVNVSQSSGNSIRDWVHCEGSYTPMFNSNGYVTGTDKDGTLIEDMRNYVQGAASRNVLVFFTLWNGAVSIKGNEKGLVTDTNKLQSYLDHVLTPLVKALKNETGLGGYEIINEPEGSVSISSNSEPCFDTKSLSGTGAGWTGSNIQMKDLQMFVNRQAAAIHAADPKALVTVGSWSEHSSTDNFGYTDYWKDECLQKAGGQNHGTLDFRQMHSYAHGGHYGSHAPFEVQANAYGLNKPLVIGEFASTSSDGRSIEQLYEYAHSNGYSGSWDWDAIGQDHHDNEKTANKGMESLSKYSDVHINVDFKPIPDRCDCSDVPPNHQYSCQQQAGWGKCSESWMQGYCCRSCHACQGCS